MEHITKRKKKNKTKNIEYKHWQMQGSSSQAKSKYTIVLLDGDQRAKHVVISTQRMVYL
jgi:hypothetical protein